MEGNWRPTQPDASLASSMDAASGDWRNQLQPEARQRIVNKIMETLKGHLPTSVPEGLNELRKIAIRFEEKIYTAATSQLDYLGKLSLKMLSMETKTQQSAPINPAISNSGGVNQNPTDPALSMQSQANNPGQPLAVPNWSAVLPQNLQNNTSASMQGSSGPAPALTSFSGLTQSNISGVTQASNLQNMPGLSQVSVNNSMGQGAQTDIYANAQRQMQERQQQQRVISQQQQQQQQSQNPLMYQHQVQQRMLNQRMQQQQQQEQQQQQSLLQPNQLQSTQPSLLQMSSSLQSNQSNIQQTQAGNTQSAPQTGLQQNQLNEIQQSVPSLLQSNPQSVARQQQAQSLHQQAPSLQQQSMPISQQSNLSQQQQMMGQQGNMPNMQQNQLLEPQNSIGDIQQQQPRLPIQQNSFLSMQQQRQMMNQQTLALQQQQQQQQLGSQSNMSGLQQQQQMLGPLTSVSNMQPHQRAMLMQKNAAQQQQQQNQQSSLTLLLSQGPQSQHQSSQQQLLSQYQSQPAQLQQQLMMQQQTNSLQREMQQRLQGSDPLLQAQNAMEQKPFIQAQRGLPEVSSSTSVDSTAQTGNAGGVDWQEECYQKVKAMKEQYFADLTEFHQKVALKLQQQEALIPLGKQAEQHEKLKSFRTMLERMLALLQLNKNGIPVGMKEKLTMYEKQMMNIVTVNRSKKISPQVQGQQQFQHPNLGNAHPMRQQQQSHVSQMQPDNHANQRVKVSETVAPEEPSSSHICTGGTEKAKEPTFNCPICMCTMISPFSTICGHIFCEDCIRAAIKRRKECPTCRAKLTGKNNIHRVFLPTAD